jgi:RimJ/RimL family protein N-acetyltransferase
MSDEIHSERLLMRAYVSGDAARVTTCINDPRIYRNVGRIKPGQSEDETRQWIASHPLGRAADTDHVWAIISDDILIGAVGAHRRTVSDPYETGYWIAPDQWGHGYATEAAGALLNWLEETRNVRATVSGHFTDNPASGRVLTKLGYLYTGRGTYFCMGRNESVEHRDMARIA